MSDSEARPEDRNASQLFTSFEDGMTLAELTLLVAELRRRGAPVDARPQVSTNDRHEIVGIVCVYGRDAASAGTSAAPPSPEGA